MRIILLKDIAKLGRRGELKEVANGYARNFLIPKKMAVLANDYDLKKIDEELQAQTEEAEQELIQYQALASNIDGAEIVLAVKVSEDGNLFGAVSRQQIADKLNDSGYTVTKEQVKLKKPIKELGEHDITIAFPHNLETTIKLIVVEGKAKKK